MKIRDTLKLVILRSIIYVNIGIIINNLTKDPELKYILGSGKAVTTFTIAMDRGLSKAKKKELESKGKPTADFIRTVTWGKQAENCATYLKKGRLVAVSGSIRTSSSRDESGNMNCYTDVNAFKVEFLEWGSSKSDAINPDDFSSVEDDDNIPF